MAYNVHWQIDFYTPDEEHYRVEILEDEYWDDIVHLLGAEDPFETEDDNSSDAFTPIRKQTGSLRIADNGYDLDGNQFYYTNLLPDGTFDRQVRLWKVGTTNILRWIGYIRPDSLTSRLFDAVSIREFRLTCPLGALYEITVKFSNTKTDLGTVRTIGQILHTALGSLNIDWDYIYKQNNVYGRNDLLAKISLLNFIDNNEPTHTTPSQSDIDAFAATWQDDSTSWGDVLEDICKFWGWTIYSRAKDVYIVALYQLFYFTKFAFADLNDTNNYTLPDEAISSMTFFDLVFASTNHSECRRLGYKDINVQASVDAQDVVLNPLLDELTMSYWGDEQTNDIVHVSREYMYVLRRMGTAAGQQNASMQFAGGLQIYESRTLNTSSNVQYIVARHDSWAPGEFKTATAFRFQNAICCYKGGQSGALTFFAQTLEDVIIPLNSVICIDAHASLSVNPDPLWPSTENTAPPYEDGKPILEGRKVRAALRVGDKYWNADLGVWQTTATTFELTFRKDGSIVTPINEFEHYGFNPQGILFDNHNGSSGFCIYVTSNSNNGEGLCGRMKLFIYATPYPASPNAKQENGVLDNLTVSIYNEDSKLDPKNKGVQEYSGIGSVRFNNRMNISLNMASGDKNVYGRGQLYNSDFSLLTQVTFRNTQDSTVVMKPEERLLQRMQQFYGGISTQKIVEVKDDATAELPSTVMYDDLGNTFLIQSVSHKWREGTMKLTLI